MKKLWFLLLVPVFGAAAVLIWQNLPEKRFARHMIKARLYAKASNFTAAQLEYEKAYGIKEKFTPYVSLEVLELMNKKSLQDRNLKEALENTRKFVEGHPNSREGQVLLSQLSFQAGDLETAFDAVHAALRIDPAYFPARLLLTRVRTVQGRLDLAEEQLRFLYRKYPDSLQALLPLAENLLKQGRTAESRVFIREVLEDHPRNSAALLMLVDTYLLERQTDSAQAVLDSWQKRGDSELAAPLAVRRARFHALAGRYAQAEGILAPHTASREENAVAILELAMIQAIKARYDSALEVYSTLAEELPAMRRTAIMFSIYLHLKNVNPAKALEQAKTLQIGGAVPELVPVTLACYLALGQDNKAADLISAQPDTVQAALKRLSSQWLPDKEYMGHWALVEYFRIHGQGYWTLLAQQEFHRRWPKNSLAISLLANQLAYLRQFGVAARLLEDLPSRSPQVQVSLLTLYIKGGEREKARAMAERILAASPRQPGLNSFLADYAWSKGEKEKGIALFRKELEANPDDLIALNNLAWEYGIVRADFAQARPYVERLRTLDSRDARIWDTIGWILARHGKAAEGEKYVRDALNLVPDYPSYLYHMAWILSERGDKAGAKKHVQSALDSKVPFEERKAAEAFLAQLG